MKNIVVSEKDLSVLVRSIEYPTVKPIGMLSNYKSKFLVISMLPLGYSYQRIDNLNLSPSAVKYNTLELFVEKESKLGAKFILFDSWKEFYQWCAE
jgi:hypothetical protein